MLNYKILNLDKNAEWVTFIHGFGGDMSFWNPQIDEFIKVFNVLLIDLRGHGQSKIQSNTTYSLKLAVDDVLKVLDFLNISKTHLIGSSFGTIIVKAFANDYPERTLKIILTGAIFKLDKYQNFLLSMGRILHPLVGYNGILKVFTRILMAGKNQKKERTFVIKIGKNLGRDEFKKWSIIAKTLRPDLFKIWSSKSEIPTLIVMGSEDKLFLPQAKKAVANLTDITLKIINKCGHVVNLAKPKDFNKLALDFLTSQYHSEGVKRNSNGVIEASNVSL